MAEYCMNCMAPLEGAVCPECGYSGSATSAPHQLVPGTILAGRHLVGNVIGQGGFGITYIGRDLTLNTREAIKEYYPTGFANRNTESSDTVTVTSQEHEALIEEGKERFLGEARVLARFQGSPGIVSVRDFIEANATAYITMEYLDGRDLRTCLKERLFTADEAFALMVPIMDVLEKIHAENIVHRDISPDNIMLLKDGSLRLMDFGAARIIDYSDQQTVSIMLKAGYAPEEQYRPRGALGPWTDVYALCATIYKCITGITPDMSLQRLVEDEIQWPSEMGVEISELQEAVLRKGMSPYAAGRFQSIAEMRAALEGGVPAALLASAEVGAAGVLADGSEHTYMPGAPADAVAEAAGVAADAPVTRMVLTGSKRSRGRGRGQSASHAHADAAVQVPCDTGASAASAPAVPTPSATAAAVGQNGTHGSPVPARRGRLALVAGAVAVVAVVVALVFAVAGGVFSSARYTVTFDAAGGSAVPAKVVTGGEQLEEPPAPARENYTFKGWYDDASPAAVVAFPLEVTSDTLLHAAWDEVLVGYTVKYVDASSKKALKGEKSVKGEHVGSNVTEKAPLIAGYTLQSKREQRLVLSADGAKNTITFKYKKEEKKESSSSSGSGYSGSSGSSASSSGSSSSSKKSLPKIDWD